LKSSASDDTKDVSRSVFRRSVSWLATLVLAGLTCACRSNSGPKTIDNPDPDLKIRAILDSDMSAIPALIDQLSSDDSAVRFYAIADLKQKTGETFGYLYYVDEEKRAASVNQWRAWLKGWQAGRKSMGSK
jgi:hypothetical protein